MVDCSTHEIPSATLASEREIRAMLPEQRLARATTIWLSYSEVCCHMQVAGERRPVVPVRGNMAQILNTDGSLFSFPVTRGEAGLPYEQIGA